MPEAQDRMFVFHTDKLSFKSEETNEGKRYLVEGYISTPDLDLVNDIVTEKALKDMMEQLMNRSIKLDFEHEAFRGETDIEAQINKAREPLGKIIDQFKDSKGIRIIAELNPKWKKFDSNGNVVKTFDDVWFAIKKGFYDAFSIAFVPIKTAFVTKDGQQIRLLDKVNLLNVALTGNPVNTHARMIGAMAKSLEFLKSRGDTKMPEDKFVEGLKSCGYFDDEYLKAKFPWDECIARMKKEGYSDESAKKICAAIKRRTVKHSFDAVGKSVPLDTIISIVAKTIDYNRGDIMSEETQNTETKDEPKEPEQKSDQVQEQPQQPEQEQEQVKNLEVKDNNDEIVSKLNELHTKLKSMEEKLNEPVVKGKQEDMKSNIDKVAKKSDTIEIKGVLDFIA